jgi:hypothetical protein
MTSHAPPNVREQAELPSRVSFVEEPVDVDFLQMGETLKDSVKHLDLVFLGRGRRSTAR